MTAPERSVAARGNEGDGVHPWAIERGLDQFRREHGETPLTPFLPCRDKAHDRPLVGDRRPSSRKGQTTPGTFPATLHRPFDRRAAAVAEGPAKHDDSRVTRFAEAYALDPAARAARREEKIQDAHSVSVESLPVRAIRARHESRAGLLRGARLSREPNRGVPQDTLGELRGVSEDPRDRKTPVRNEASRQQGGTANRRTSPYA